MRPLPDWVEHVMEVARQVSYPGLQIEVLYSYSLGGDEASLRVVCPDGTCTVTGEPHPWKGRPWRLSQHMVDGEIVQTAFKAIMTAQEHEARESFKYKGAAVFGPHFDIDLLVDLARDPQGIKERESVR